MEWSNVPCELKICEVIIIVGVVMSINYKFQDLAKFVEDVKFLLINGGARGLLSPGVLDKSMPEMILRVVWIVVLWVLIFIIVYVIYKIIFKGYPRFPMDMLKFNFYNKIDVKSSVGDANGLLFDSINDLSSVDVKDVLTLYGNKFFANENNVSIFQQVKDAIISEYQPEHNTDGTKEALSDYYKYFAHITNNMGLKGLSSNDKVFVLKSLYEQVFLNYIQWYLNQVVAKERMINCMFNNGKTDDKRSEIHNKKKALEKEYAMLLMRTNCKKITTTCEFAKLFVDTDITLECKGEGKKLIDKWLKALGYDAKNQRYKQLEKEIRKDKKFLGVKLPKQKKRAKERIKTKSEEQKMLKIQMIDIQKLAVAKAEAESKEINLPMIGNATYKDIITYDSDARVAPSTSRTKAETDKMQYTVYVPCYELYKHYYNIHRDTMFRSLDKLMTMDEIVAYIFLTDIEKIMENNDNAKNIQLGNDDDRLPTIKPTLIGKFLQLHMAIESMAGIVETALTDPQSPVQYAHFLTFPDDDVLSGSISEVVKYNNEIVPFYSFSKGAPLSSTSTQNQKRQFVETYAKSATGWSIKYDYTYYLMEVFVNLATGSMYDHFVNHIMCFDYNRSSLVAFLNMPVDKQNDEGNRVKFGVSKDLLLFVRQHPIFTVVYLGNNKDNTNSETYQRIIGMFLNMLQDQPKLATKAIAIGSLNLDDTTNIIRHVEAKVLGLKKVNVCLHMIHLYFSRYRDSFHERDSISKGKISRDGFVDIYEQHNISYEFGSFFARLFEPFKQEFLDGRIKASWTKAFYGPRFNPDLKQDKRNISYWRDFNSFWVDYMGKKMDGMMKGWWKNFKNYTKPRFG